MAYVSPYGKFDGLADRLKEWKYRLSEDRSYPWMGLGLIADIEAAIAMIGDQPEPKEETEYDL